MAEHLGELTAFEPNGFPFVSLYLNAQADQHGRDNFHSFIRKEFSSRAITFAAGSCELESFERVAGRVVRYLNEKLETSANGLAIFARSGDEDFFKAIQLDAPIQKNRLHVSDRPHIYPLARLISQNPPYAAVIADTRETRIFVFDLGRVARREEFITPDRSFAADGEQSPMRHHRRVENQQHLHAKETVELLERIVREEKIERIILAGDEVIIPLLRERLPGHLAGKVIDILRLDIRTPEHEILKATTESLRADNSQTDAEKVRGLFDQYRADGLAVVGYEKTMDALVHGQANELLLSASPDDILFMSKSALPVVAEIKPENKLSRKMIADTLISHAGKSGAEVTFIEDRNLLAEVGGVGAFLRYRT